jgi:hypothetical protein
MSDCEILQTCIFFNDRMEAMPSTSGWLKARYCRDRFEECARYRVYKTLGRPQVPLDLFPTQFQRALDLIEAPPEAAAPGEPGPAARSSGKPTRPR